MRKLYTDSYQVIQILRMPHFDSIYQRDQVDGALDGVLCFLWTSHSSLVLSRRNYDD